MKTKKRVDGLSFYVERRYACGSKDDMFFLRVFAKVGEESRFSRSGSSCEEDEVTRFIHGGVGCFEFLRDDDMVGHRLSQSIMKSTRVGLESRIA